MEIIDATFGEFLAIERKRNHLTQGQLASLVGLSRNYISQIEAGKANLTLVRAIKIAKQLGFKVTFEAVYTESDDENVADV